MRRYLDPLQVAMAVCVVLLVAWGHPLPVMSMPALSAEDFSPMAEETLAARPKPSSTLAFANEEEGVMEEHRLPLGKLTNEKPLILKGLNPSASLYLTLDEEERIVQGQLEIVFSHSETLLPHSSLTAKVNGVPIGSVQLGPENRDRAQWLLSVPAAALEGNGVELSFSGFLWTNDDPCLIIDDESSWVTIWPESALTAQSWLAYFQPNLGRFPYPFLRVRAFEKPTTLLVLPDEADGKAWVVALRLAAHLSKVAAWRELNLLPMREGELTPELARSYDIIFVGLADQLDALHEYAAQGPLRWAGEGRFLSPDGLSIEEDMGILIEMTSPWNPTRGILYVTGLGQVALERAAQALLQASFTSQARGVYALIRGVPEGPRQEMASWGNITFKELGYHDFVLQGVGTQTRDLVLDLPGRLRVDGAQMQVYISHSSLVCSDTSYFNVYLNGTPVKGVRLNAKNLEHTLIEVTLPAEHFVPGQNVIQFMANLRACDWDCRDPLWTEIWAVVHQDSRIHLKSSSLGDDMTLDHFPLQLDDSTTLVFPAQPSSQEWMGAFAFLTRLGRDLPDGVDRFTIITADTVEQELLQDRPLVLVGRPENNPLLAEVADKIFFPTFVLAGRPIGLVQVMPSPWNAAYPLLVVTGQQDEGAGWALLLLGDSRRSAWLQGDLAVVDQQGIVTTLNTTASPTPVSGVIEGTRPTPGWVFWALAGLLGFPVLALAAVVVRRYISARLQAGGKDGSDQ